MGSIGSWTVSLSWLAETNLGGRAWCHVMWVVRSHHGGENDNECRFERVPEFHDWMTANDRLGGH